MANGAIGKMFREFWPYTAGDRLRLLGSGLLSLILLGAELASVALFEAMTSHVLETRHLTNFWILAGAWLAVAAAGAVAMAWSGWLAGLAAERVQLRLRDSVFAHLLRLPAGDVEERRTGDLMVRLLEDVAVVEGAVASGPVSLFTSVAGIVGFAAAALVQAFGRQDAESGRLHREGLSWLRAKMAETRLDSIYQPLVYFLETCCVLLVLGLGAWEVARGRLSLAGLLAFAACLAYLYPPVRGLSGLVLTVSEASASAARLGDVLHARSPVTESTSARHELAPGPSGAGKSTIARLLLRFGDPEAGCVRLDGIDIRELSLRTLRYNVTLLQQEALLFPGTVADNIRYGRTGATDLEVEAAARAADAHTFVTGLPAGYGTVTGQHGRLLSGGQRQRICLARAFLRDAPALVLDEPTAGLDQASAQRLLEVLRRYAAGHTVIVITHDPLVAEAADEVLYLPGSGGAALVQGAGAVRA